MARAQGWASIRAPPAPPRRNDRASSETLAFGRMSSEHAGANPESAPESVGQGFETSSDSGDDAAAVGTQNAGRDEPDATAEDGGGATDPDFVFLADRSEAEWERLVRATA